MKKEILIIILLIILSGCKEETVSKKENKKSELSATDNYSISLIRLIATPEKYDGKRIQIIGYLNLGFEGNAVYLHEEDYENHNTQNAFWIESISGEANFDRKKCDKKHVLIEGTFNKKHHGHLGLFGGAIKDITRIDVIPKD